MKVTSGSTASVNVDRKATRERQEEKNGTSVLPAIQLYTTVTLVSIT